jgi:CPA1 family monovalent cation:H+ antiporter
MAYQMIRPLDQYGLEIMISLALTASTFSLANAVGASGPIAVAVSGLLIGGRATRYIMSETTRRNPRLFWSVIDDILNAVLFLLLGFEVLALTFNLDALASAVLSIPLAIVVRGLSVIVPVFWLHYRNPNLWRGAAVLTWGGLRGGISVALALSIPQSAWRNDILLICYTVVVFTIIVQGLTLNRVIRRLAPSMPVQH